MSKRKVYLEAKIRGLQLHSLYDELINYPPEGYEFVVDEESRVGNKLQIFNKKIHRYNCLRGFTDTLRPWAYFFYYRINERKAKNVCLTYSSEHLVFRKEPWVMDLSHVGALVAYGYSLNISKKFIEKVLASEYCKKIMPWWDAGKKTLLLNLNCKKFEEKIETVYLSVHPKEFVKDYDSFSADEIKLLFVGTGNVFNIPDSFDLKGGKVVLEAFKYLNRKYSNLKLVIKSYVPPEIKRDCRKFKNIEIIDRVVPWRVLERKFQTADIFLHPGYFSPYMVFLDAMSYELPIVTTDVWANPEFVKDGETGFLIKQSDNVPYYAQSFIPKEGTADVMKAIRTVDPNLIRELVEKTTILIEDEKLRHKIGRAARKEVETGKFSIEKRNEKLKKIFDEAIGDAT